MKLLRKLMCWWGWHDYKVVVPSMFYVVQVISSKPMTAKSWSVLDPADASPTCTYFTDAVVGRFECKYCGRRL